VDVEVHECTRTLIIVTFIISAVHRRLFWSSPPRVSGDRSASADVAAWLREHSNGELQQRNERGRNSGARSRGVRQARRLYSRYHRHNFRVLAARASGASLKL
jgi:hypothetical protein